MYYIDKVLLKEPKLYKPGKKPTTPVRINWKHPLSSNLKSVLISGLYGNIIVDLVNSINAITTANYPDMIEDEIGLCHSFNGTNDYLTTETLYNNTSRLSILTKIKCRTGMGNGDRLFEIGGWNTNDGGIGMECTSAPTTWATIWGTSNTSATFGSQSLSTTSWTTFIITSNTTGPSNILYKNGIQIGSNTSFTRATTATELTIASDNNTKTSNNGNLLHDITIVWHDRIINANEALALYMDPYQILEPI